MTNREKEVVLAFYKEQKKYNEAFAEFIQVVCNCNVYEDDDD